MHVARLWPFDVNSQFSQVFQETVLRNTAKNAVHDRSGSIGLAVTNELGGDGISLTVTTLLYSKTNEASSLFVGVREVILVGKCKQLLCNCVQTATRY